MEIFVDGWFTLNKFYDEEPQEIYGILENVRLNTMKVSIKFIRKIKKLQHALDIGALEKKYWRNNIKIKDYLIY